MRDERERERERERLRGGHLGDEALIELATQLLDGGIAALRQIVGLKRVVHQIVQLVLIGLSAIRIEVDGVAEGVRKTDPRIHQPFAVWQIGVCPIGGPVLWRALLIGENDDDMGPGRQLGLRRGGVPQQRLQSREAGRETCRSCALPDEKRTA